MDLSAARPDDFENYDLSVFDFILLIGVDEGFRQIDAEKTVSLNPEIEACDLDSMRLLRDWIKNEVFIIYKTRFR